MPFVASTAMEGAENYYRWQLELVGTHVTARVIEIGCGVGEFTRLLLGRDKVVSIDRDPVVIDYVRARLGAPPEWEGVVADACDETLPDRLAGHACDSVIALNVVEHLADDRRALRIMRALLPCGGKAVVLVPAHQWLYGTFDEEAGHYRRYTRDDLAAKVQAAGFDVDAALYFNTIGVIGWFVNYRLLRIRTVTGGTTTQIRLFDRWVVPVARRIERVIPPGFGLSAICLATAR